MKKLFTLTALGCLLVGTAAATPIQMEKTNLLNVDRNAEMTMTHHGKEMKVRRNGPAREMEVTPIITEVQGREQTMLKNSAGYYIYFIYLYPYETVDGFGTVVYGDNNEIYFKDILSNANTETYVKGEIEGDVINMSLPQTVYYYDDYGYGLNLSVLKYTEWEENGTMSASYELCEDITNVTFTIDPADGGISLNLPEGDPEEYMLGLVYTDDSTWCGYGDFYQEYMPVDIEFYSMPEGVEATTYTLINETYGYPVNVAIDGDYVYFQGLCEYFGNTAVVRADYDATTGIASIPQDQNVGIYGGTYLITTKVVLDDLEEELVLAPETMTYDLVVDLANKKITSKYYEGFQTQPYLCFNAASDRVYYLDLLRNIVMQIQDSYAGTPQNPYDLFIDDYYYDYYGFVDFYFSTSEVSTTGDLLLAEDLYYEIYVDGDLMEFEYDPDLDAYYGIEGVVTEIPYTLNNGWDIYASGQTRDVGLYFEGYDTLGVRMIYKYEGNTTYSAIVTLDVNSGEITTGVKGINGQNVVKAEYFDLQGRRISNPDNGIFVQRNTMSDGTIVTRKVVKR